FLCQMPGSGPTTVGTRRDRASLPTMPHTAILSRNRMLMVCATFVLCGTLPQPNTSRPATIGPDAWRQGTRNRRSLHRSTPDELPNSRAGSDETLLHGACILS